MNKALLDIKWVREQFPGLKQPMVFMDNAGGSQTLKSVMNRITEYLTFYDVQLGASYKNSQRASEKLDESRHSLKSWVNAKHIEEIIIGSSTTMLLRILSLCISQNWRPGDEIIITNSDHEANMAPWRDLSKVGLIIKTWKINPTTFKFETKDLEDLMTPSTKLVAMTHVSNILGTINPIKEISKIVHSHNALICVDGVAYAPHRLIDVQELDVDFYVFSTYKTFGPHQALMYGKIDILRSLNGINHAFIDSIPYKFQPGNLNYELSYSLAAIPEYIKQLGGKDLAEGFEAISDYEQLLTSHLLDFLNSYPEIKIIGETTANKNERVSTISFVHNRLNSKDIVEAIDAHNVGIRFGDFYAVELINDLQLRHKNGIVRVSLVHYNTLTEVDNLINIFKKVL